MEGQGNEQKRLQTEDDRKAELEEKIRLRVSCEARAFDIVNRLLETSVTEEYLKEACQLISRSHYEDVVEERAIVYLCGYPLCDSPLTNVPKKKYHISTKSNQVFDITERKNFCSNQCYKASKHFQKQVPDFPVWGRENERRVNYDILSTASTRGEVGEEVIGASHFTLKQEVQALEKLDLRSQQAGDMATKTTVKKEGLKQAQQKKKTPVSPESQEQEEGLNKTMAQLTLTPFCMQPPELDTVPVAACAMELSKPEEKSQMLSGKTNEDNSQMSSEEMKTDEVGAGAASRTDENEDILLECSMKRMVLTESVSKSEVDSDDEDGILDDTADKLTRQTSVSVSEVRECLCHSREVNKPEVSGAQAAQLMSALTTSPQEESTKSSTERESGNDILHQQPGESKAAYLIRLLNRRKDHLSKMADIQSPSVSHAGLTQSDFDVHHNDSELIRHETSAYDFSTATKTESSHYETPITHAYDNQANSDNNQTLFRSQHVQPKPLINPSNKPGKHRISPLEAVSKIVQQWVTPETLTYLGFQSSEEAGQENFHSDPEMQQKYQNLCQRLAGQEKDFDEALGEEEVGKDVETERRKPLPHFEELMKQTAEFQMKVAEFFSGPTSRKKKPAKQGDEGDGTKVAEDETPAYDRPIVLPAVDSHNQQLIRRRIVMDRLSRSVSALLPPLGLCVQDVSGVLRELVFTFSFSSRNIIFKTAEWSLVSLILLKMLSYKSSEVSSVFESESRRATLDVVLSRLGGTSASLSQFVHSMLTESG